MGHVDCDLGSFPDVCGGRLTVGAIFKDIGLEVGNCRARGKSRSREVGKSRSRDHGGLSDADGTSLEQIWVRNLHGLSSGERVGV